MHEKPFLIPSGEVEKGCSVTRREPELPFIVSHTHTNR